MLPQSFTPTFLRQLELFTMRARRAYLGSRQGGHLSQKRGHGIEFSDYRQYELGDNPRWIDWGVFARSDRLYVRRYQEEQNLSIMVLLDTSASMTNPAIDKKWERARELAIALSYVGLIGQDTVMVAPLGYQSIPEYHGPRSIHSLGKNLLELSLAKIQSKPARFSASVHQAISRVRFPGIAVFISDFLIPTAEVRAAFNSMLAKNLEITAIQILGDSDLSPFAAGEEITAIDSETGEQIELSASGDSIGRYEHLLKNHNQEIQKFCASRGIRFSSTKARDDLSQVLLKSLTKTGLLS